MSTYAISTLLQLWRNNKATVEQAMGHALQHIASLTERQSAVEKRLHHLEQVRSDHPSPTTTQEPPKA